MFRAPRGTHDVLPEEQPYWAQLRQAIQHLCATYGYDPIDVPTFEATELFARGVGQGTDIVEKEMYSFVDKGDEHITLRPEATAGIVRAYVEHGMARRPQPVKLYIMGSMFRYERPQAGRFREFHQFNFEAIGEADPALDAEVVAMAWQLYGDLGFTGLSLQLNSIGDPNCRPAYVERLVAYFEGVQDRLCNDCQGRLRRNPLRMLDCKNPNCQALAADAPRSVDHLCVPCAEHFAALRGYLEVADLPYTLNWRLVRGLDYYTRTVFEVWPPDAGSQGALGGGGRYDGLIEQIGGRPTPSIGFATGMERIVRHLRQERPEAPPLRPAPVLLAFVGAEARRLAFQLAQQLRSRGVAAACPYGDRSLKAQLRVASSQGAPYVAILGEDEIARGQLALKDMATGEQRDVPLAEALATLAALGR